MKTLDLYISERAKNWLAEKLSKYKEEMRFLSHELSISYDPGTSRQTSNVLDLYTKIDLVQKRIDEYSYVINRAVVVKDGDMVEGVKIGTKICIAYQGEKPEIFIVGTRWDVEMSFDESQKYISFYAPITRAVLSQDISEPIEFNGNKVNVISVDPPI